MTALKDRLVRLVSAAGPISVADYMATCLFDPQHGYYTTREPFGAQGDFTTAPEISQMFGELVAVWLVTEWRSAGRPADSTIAEIGPGRGTMMKDMARTILRLAPKLAAGARFALVETSPRLRDVQRATLADSQLRHEWHESVSGLGDGPLFIVGNELFDALPVRQFVKTSSGWRERMVGLSDDGELAFVTGAAGLDPALLPADAADAAEGAIVEVAPAREALMEEIAGHIARRGGAGLFIDYGYLRPAVGDTLQALTRHRHEDVLASPGQADLTAHVDFAALATVAVRHGLAARLETQGDFLLRSGLLERAGALGSGKEVAVQERLRSEVERLASSAEMGNLFKVLSLSATAGAMPFSVVAD